MPVRNFFNVLSPQQLLRLAFRFRPESEYLICDGERLTRRQVLGNIEKLAEGLQTLGIRAGDRIVSLLPARPEAVYPLFLPHLLGTINVPLNPLLGALELRHILENCRPQVIITQESWYGRSFLSLLSAALPELDELKLIIVVDGRERGQIGGAPVMPYEDVVDHGRLRKWEHLSGDGVVRITYTSGTTGWPKGVVHVRKRAWGIAVRGSRSRLGLSTMRCLLLPFPLHHFAGMFGIYVALLAGGKVILSQRLHPHRLLESIEREGVTQMAGSPTIFRLLLSTNGQQRYDLSSLRRITVSTEPLDHDLYKAIVERTGCIVENYYGTTECNMISWTAPDDSVDVVANTVGKPAPGAEIRIVDDDRHPLPAGETGEIAARTAQMMSGYHRQPDLTAEVLDEQGWFYTGDRGYLDPLGYLHISGRKKDIIIRGGENIAAIEIESFLETHPAVRRVGVVGVPHKLGGESIWAFVQLNPGATVSARELLAHCDGKIAAFKIPDKIYFVEQLPMTATGKLQKFKLRRMAEEER